MMLIWQRTSDYMLTGQIQSTRAKTIWKLNLLLFSATTSLDFVDGHTCEVIDIGGHEAVRDDWLNLFENQNVEETQRGTPVCLHLWDPILHHGLTLGLHASFSAWHQWSDLFRLPGWSSTAAFRSRKEDCSARLVWTVGMANSSLLLFLLKESKQCLFRKRWWTTKGLKTQTSSWYSQSMTSSSSNTWKERKNSRSTTVCFLMEKPLSSQ